MGLLLNAWLVTNSPYHNIPQNSNTPVIVKDQLP